MGGPVLIALAGRAAAADCPEVPPILARAEQEILSLRLADAAASLGAAEAAFACRPVSPETVATFWLLAGARDTLGGDPEAATEAFAAARRTAPDTWVEPLGAKLRQAWADAPLDPETAALAVEPEGLAVRIDGRPATPGPVAVGRHLVQAGPRDGEVAFALQLQVLPGTAARVRTGLPAPEPEPVVVAVPAPPPAPRGRRARSARAGSRPAVAPRVGVGAQVAFGDPVSAVSADGEALAEPAVRVGLPVELGLEVAGGGAWARAQASVAPLLGGTFVFARGGDAVGWPLGAGGDVAGGAVVGPDLRVGASAGVALPGRLAFRALASAPVGPLRAEVRAGADLATARGAQPAVGLAFGWAPRPRGGPDAGGPP